jgi:hypothetical protein
MKKIQENQVILHGESMVFPSKIPKSAKKMDTSDKKYVIVAPSETTGNHHVVDVMEGVTFFEDEKTGTLYMQNEVETNIRCVIASRHSEIKLPAGTYEFGTQQEYDPFEARLKKVRD